MSKGDAPDNNEPSGRTLKVDGKKIRSLRLKKGWTPERLAKEAKCSVKSIKNAELSKKMFISSIEKIAAAFGVEESSQLVIGIYNNVNESSRFKVPTRFEMIYQIDFEELDEGEELAEKLRIFAARAGTKGKIIVLAVTEGSVVISLELESDDALRIIEAFKDGGLDDLYIVSIKVSLKPVISWEAAFPAMIVGGPAAGLEVIMLQYRLFLEKIRDTVSLTSGTSMKENEDFLTFSRN